jgi:hypothetical protein
VAVLSRSTSLKTTATKDWSQLLELRNAIKWLFTCYIVDWVSFRIARDIKDANIQKRAKSTAFDQLHDIHDFVLHPRGLFVSGAWGKWTMKKGGFLLSAE